MAEVFSSWYCVGIRYSENTATSKTAGENAVGQSHGTVSLNKQMVVTLECKVDGGNVPDLPVAGSSSITVNFRPNRTVAISSVTGRNYYLGESTESATNWRVEGPAVFVGYEDALMGVEIWQCNLACEASDLKRGYWYGSMSPTKFHAMTSETRPQQQA